MQQFNVVQKYGRFMAEYCQNAAGILTYFKAFWQDYVVKISCLCAVGNY